MKESDFDDDKKEAKARKRESKCQSLLIQYIDDTQIDLIQDKLNALN